MSHRFLCLTFAITVVLPVSAAVAGQEGSSTSKRSAEGRTPTWVQLLTPDGQPDLQGTWTNLSNVPLERPKELGAKEFYTVQEKAVVDKREFQGDRAALPEAHYDLSQFGLDPKQGRFAPNLRTSLIIGPVGRIPPYTPEEIGRAHV